MHSVRITDIDLRAFCRALPKIELHAHLTGSISRQALHAIWLQKQAAGLSEGPDAIEDPLTAIPPSAGGVNIDTFFPIFNTTIYKLVTSKADVRSTTAAVLASFAADNVVHLELRTTPRAAAGLSAEAYVDTVLSEISLHNSTTTTHLKAYLILSIDRRQSPAAADATVDFALARRDRGVVGVDLCGDPTKGDVRDFTLAFQRAKAGGLKTTVHFGEVRRAATEGELETLLAWEPDRLGHVIHLGEEVEREVSRRKVGLELCLSCNVLAGMGHGQGYEKHHFGTWWRRGGECAIALSTDDVGIFESELSNEYALAGEHFGLSREDLIALSRSAASAAFADDDERARVLDLLDSFEAQQHLQGRNE